MENISLSTPLGQILAVAALPHEESQFNSTWEIPESLFNNAAPESLFSSSAEI